MIAALVVLGGCTVYLIHRESIAHAGHPLAISNAGFLPTVPSPTPAPGAAPEGMVWLPGGEFSMGAADAPDMNDVGMKATEDSRPIHRVYVDAFWMDKTDVTNQQFASVREGDGLCHGRGTQAAG